MTFVESEFWLKHSNCLLFVLHNMYRWNCPIYSNGTLSFSFTVCLQWLRLSHFTVGVCYVHCAYCTRDIVIFVRTQCHLVGMMVETPRGFIPLFHLYGFILFSNRLCLEYVQLLSKMSKKNFISKWPFKWNYWKNWRASTMFIFGTISSVQIAITFVRLLQSIS